MTYTLSMFNTGQVTLPKRWREKFNTKHFLAEEKEGGLFIKPITNEKVIEYENEDGFGLLFPQGIDPNEIIKAVKKIDG